MAQELSFTRAADALGVTASAASLQIRALEDYLGRPLFRRNGRHVHLTAEGSVLLPRVRQALEQVERAVDDLRREHPTGSVRISTMASFLQLWLLPRVERFRVAHPQVDLHLHTSIELVDFVHDDFHLALRMGNGGYPNVHSEKLLDDWLVPVCTPALYEKYGPLRDVDDLRRYPMLHSTGEPWTAWLFNGHGTADVGSFRGSVFDGSWAVVRMAEQGAGLALARWSLVADAIESGRLVRASPRTIKFEQSYWLVRPARVLQIPEVEAFVDWVRVEARNFKPPPPLSG